METETIASPAIDTAPMLQGLPTIVEGVEFTSLGLNVTVEEVPLEGIHKLFASVIGLSRASNWLLGDTLRLADRTWGNKHTGSKYEEASKHTGLSISTLKHIVSVCKAIPLDQRHPELSFSHHLDVCGTADTVEEREELLSTAKTEDMSSKQFRKHLRKVKEQKERATMWETSDENFDRPFGLMQLDTDETTDNPSDYPMSIEITRVSAWFEDRNLKRLPSKQRRFMLADLAPLLKDIYTLYQMELKSNPNASWDLPFKVEPPQERSVPFADAG